MSASESVGGGEPGRGQPPLGLRLLGQALSFAIARAPWTWTLLRRPTRRFWERSAATWDERIRPERAEHLAPLAVACDLLKAEPASILELGAGTGAGALLLASRFPDARVQAVDISGPMIAAAKAKLPAELAGRVEFEVGDAASLPQRDEAYDLVAQLNVPAYVEQVARALRPGGHLIVASSLGPKTPYYTPDRVLSRACARHGLDVAFTGRANGGTYLVARRVTGGALASGAVRRHYDKTATKYDRQIAFFERILFGDGRAWVCSQAAGHTLEIAVGTGRNLRHYPPGTRLTGIELSPAMLEIARRQPAATELQADLRVGDAEALEFEDESFDTVTCTLALCTIPDDRVAVEEMWRVLRPGGRLLLLEHVRSPVRPVRAGQRLLEPLFLRLEHDHLLREPLEHVRAARFDIETIQRSKLGIVERLAARKPPLEA